MSIVLSRDPFSKVTVANDEQSENAEFPIVSMLAGISIKIKDAHCSNAEFPIVSTLAGISIEIKDAHCSNAELPIVVAFAGITTVFNLL